MTSPSVDPLLRLQDVSYRFPQSQQNTLEEISLDILAGESIGIVGPSGCGKSTLLRLIANLIEPTQGTRQVFHQELNQPGRISMVFQDARLLPWLTVQKNLMLPFELTHQPVDQSRIDQLLEMIGLDSADAQKYPRMLSGGMKMRVAVARALVLNPALLLLDEPFAAVDDLLREQLNDELIDWQKKFGFATVLVTHHLGEAVYLSSRILMLSPPPASMIDEIKIPWTEQEDSLRTTSDYTKLCSQIKHRLLNQD